MINKEKIENLSVKVLTDITEAIDKTDDAVLKLTLANLIREDVYAEWAKIQKTLGWEVTCESTLQLQAENCDVFPVAFLIREVES